MSSTVHERTLARVLQLSAWELHLSIAVWPAEDQALLQRETAEEYALARAQVDAWLASMRTGETEGVPTKPMRPVATVTRTGVDVTPEVIDG